MIYTKLKVDFFALLLTPCQKRELSTLAVVMIDAELKVTGFIALNDHPPIPAVDPSSWEQWMRNMFSKYYLASNTLFIHFISCTDSVSDFFLEEVLVSVFMNDFYLQNIILVVPPGCKIDCMAKYPAFKRRSIFSHCMKSDEIDSCYSLYVANRSDFCPKLRVRRAVEEDNDDVVDILDKKCKTLKELYGEYYVSEILSRHPEIERTIIVAEGNAKHQDRKRVVGVMFLNSNINYEKLQRNYELAPYHGLLKPDPVQREKLKRNNTLLQTFGDPIMLGQWSPFKTMEEHIRRDNASNANNIKNTRKQKRSPSKVNFRSRRGRLSASVVHRLSDTIPGSSMESEKIAYSPTMSMATDVSMMFLLDDEPLDYEIVNIDTTLLTVPEVSSIDAYREQEKICQTMDSAYRLRRKTSTMSKIEETGLLFEGKPNAFIIEIFGMRDEIDDRRAFDLLEATFECMQQYDYCLIRVPSANKGFSLLQHFTVVPLKVHICCSYALYIAHRNSVLGKMRVRKAEISDIPQIAMLLHNVEGRETIWTVEHAIQSHQHHLAYVFLNGYTLVGVGILDPPEHSDLVRVKFVLEAYMHMKYHISGQGLNGGLAMLKTVLVYPVFEPHFKFFAREIMRHSGSTALLWLTAYRNKWVTHKANGLVAAMTPLPFRVTADGALLPELKQVYQLSKNLLSFNAWFVSKKLTSIGKMNVDTRIVIVGASRTALAFLYSLLFGDSATYLTFTNVTLISTNGLPYLRHPIQGVEHMFPRHHATSDRFLKSTPFTYYVNVVQATMVEINKQDKYIVTEFGSKYYYDQLFLLMGKQYQHPDYMKDLLKREKNIRRGKIPKYVRMDDPHFSSLQMEPRVYYDTPENVFIVNNVADANRALSYVKTFLKRYSTLHIIVYGAHIDAYCCMTALLELDVKAKNIVFIECFPPEDESKSRVPFFCNLKVDQTVNSIISSLGIHHHRGYYFQNWNVNEYNVVQNVEFISNHKYLKLDCAAFFYYGKRYLNPHAFVAVNKSGLAYDGGILIDHQWRTNDPAIYAAGPATRYYRRYNVDSNQQKFYDSYEIGKTLGEQIRNQLDPLFSENVDDTCFHPGLPSFASESFSSSASSSCRCSKSSTSCDCKSYSSSSSSTSYTSRDDGVCYTCLIPRLKRPRVWYCILPGNLQYLEVRPPGAKFPHYYVQSMQYNGTVLQTYKNGYFKLHFNKDHMVDGITCLTPDSHNIENFKMLYGHSSAVLNNVLIRFACGMISDLYEFFRLPWSVFLYNDRCEEMLNVAKNLKPKGTLDGKTLEDVLREMRTNMVGVNIKSEVMNQLHINSEKNFDAITDYVIEWLTDNELILPFYITPTTMLEFSHDIPRHPAFKRCRKTFKRMLAMIS